MFVNFKFLLKVILKVFVKYNINVCWVVPGTRPLCAHKLFFSICKLLIKVGKSISANPCTDLNVKKNIGLQYFIF